MVNTERTGLPMINMAKLVKAEAVAEANEQIRNGKMRLALPLVGIRQKPSQGAMGRIEREILEEEAIKTENFRINEITKISGKGGLRTVLTPIQSFTCHGVSACDSGQKASQADLRFMLMRGSYATVLLREIMKPENPIMAGF